MGFAPTYYYARDLTSRNLERNTNGVPCETRVVARDALCFYGGYFFELHRVTSGKGILSVWIWKVSGVSSRNVGIPLVNFRTA